MATTISILSTSSTSTGFPLFLTTRKIEISGTNYLLIQSDPNSLNFVYGGNIYSVNGFLYPGATVPPFGTLWQLSTSSGRYYVDFLVNPSISYFNVTWTSLNFPYDVPVPDPNFITSLSTPGSFMPVYNPIVFTFSSPKYNKVGYRYLVDIKDSANNLINRLKVVPQPDGSGYVDIQKILSNYVSVDFSQGYLNGNCSNSYFKYQVSLGEEYLSSWDYTNFVEQIGGVFDGQVVLSNINPSITHTYVVGDQITIDTNTSGLAQNVGGLHSVVSVPNNYQVVIDVIYPNNDPSIAIPGSTRYSDSRKTGYSNLTVIINLTVWNGVFSWKDWKNFNYTNYNILSSNNYLLLTSLKPYQITDKIHERYMLVDGQSYYINYMIDGTLNNTECSLVINEPINSIIGSIRLSGITPLGNIRQFKIDHSVISSVGITEWEYVDFYLIMGKTQKTKTYRLYNDKRCKINDISIYFMDKLGSILSIPFQLRENQSITIERESSKISKSYNNRSTLDLLTGGDVVNHISSKKTYTLNTNWMNDRQMELFEIMMESPYTWISFGNDIQACIIEDTSLEIEKYKNKSLFKKNIKLRLSNQDPLNI